MGLEVFTGKVSDLVETNPPGTDPKSQGDDHLRGIKKTLIGQSINMQIGQNTDPTHNFSTSTNDDGTMRLGRGNAGAISQDIMTVDDAGRVSFPQSARALTQKTLTIQVEYTNATGAELQVNVYVNAPSAVRVLTLEVNGFSVATARAEQNVSDGYLVGTVPIGAKFAIGLTVGVGGVVESYIMHQGPISGVTP